MLNELHKSRALEKALSQRPGSFTRGDTDLVKLADMLLALPHGKVPVASRRRAYLHASLTEPVAHGNKLIRMSAYFGGAVLAFGLVMTVVLASGSFPGSPLYALKSNSQKLRVSLAGNEANKINLQLQFAEQRLAETEQILQSNATAESKAAAISELTAQNLATVETVKQVAVARKNTELLNRLTAITSTQTAVLTSAKEPQVQQAAKTALAATEAGSKVIAEAKQLVAASSDSAIANLPTTITGAIVKLAGTEINIGKDTVNTTDQTEITDSKNTAAKPTLKTGQQVTITAAKTEKGYVAQKIVVESETPAAKVKGESTDDSKEKTSTDSAPDAEPETPKVQSGFLIETPEPQYPLQ